MFWTSLVSSRLTVSAWLSPSSIPACCCCLGFVVVDVVDDDDDVAVFVAGQNWVNKT